MPPPAGGIPPLGGLAPPLEPPEVLQAPATIAVKAIKMTGFSQLGTAVDDRLDFIVLTSVWHRLQGVGASKAWWSSIGIAATTNLVSRTLFTMTI
jgi:hypothetical protein